MCSAYHHAYITHMCGYLKAHETPAHDRSVFATFVELNAQLTNKCSTTNLRVLCNNPSGCKRTEQHVASSMHTVHTRPKNGRTHAPLRSLPLPCSSTKRSVHMHASWCAHMCIAGAWLTLRARITRGSRSAGRVRTSGKPRCRIRWSTRVTGSWPVPTCSTCACHPCIILMSGGGQAPQAGVLASA